MNIDVPKYKLTFYDACCSPLCDGVCHFYVANLDEFEEKWLPIQLEHGVATINRYYRSKFGEVISDYYSDTEALNIVQKVPLEVIEVKDFNYKNKKVTLENLYNYETDFEFDELEIQLMVVQIGNKRELVGKYKAKGCKRVGTFYNRWYDTYCKYAEMYYFGNSIVRYGKKIMDSPDFSKPDKFKDYITNDKKFYADTEIEAFVWIPIKEVRSNYKLKALNKDELKILMRDILGEAG